ncbi:polysaccharide biosynthesis tyrosine autokinase [Sabulilitoribacter arenilitoris]|uniref:non-specific protein-tyrosine kinase n=1 Tax=Wocania arenilitoris TaxID=2044858 RepID=A0AAE3ENY8_9FLAO|nr:tyrosine-protein kinase family protein [Wocania arenilitoris]MCF7568948.1 polysaccharide biosynthesis tyrosine autokinase [Wocania arenilitoris]
MAYDDIEDIENSEQKSFNFDLRGFLFKLLKFWKLFVVCIIIGFFIAYSVNVRKQNIYRLSSLISLENDQNPFFTANTSISFNWGGVSGKVGKTIIALKTRNHNERVVDSLQFYIQYLKDGKYRKEEVYKKAPFYIEIDKNKGQLLGKPIRIKFISNTHYELFVAFENNKATTQKYSDKSLQSITVPTGSFTKTFNVGELVDLPFVKFTLKIKEDLTITPNSEFFIQFLNFDAIVNGYKGQISVSPYNKTSSSIITLSLAGYNKQKIVDYLNATTAILSKTDLERKNQYATNTIKFIDSTLSIVNTELKAITDTMNAFRKQTKMFNVDKKLIQVSEKISDLELKEEESQSKLQYLEILEDYLKTKTDYTKIAAPTSVGIEENNISTSVSKITALAIQRQELQQLVQEGSTSLQDLDGSIDAEKNVLLETIASTKKTIRIQLDRIRNNKANLESRLNELPEDQQQYLKIQRNLDISQEAYNVYMSKRSEAAIVKAANISDISVIEAAKDIGGGLIGPNKNLNYMMALLIGFFGPFALVFILFLLDNTIHGVDEVRRLSKIPVLGLVGEYKHDNNLVVYDKPKSAVAESFRAIRSSLQFFYKKQEKKGGRTIMLTSSVSGEGKTFCSINIASAYALSGKKTILLGLDLRKPKIFGDFNIDNNIGIVNYFIGDKSLEEITFKTHIENLDLITSGPIPPNPSELLMSDAMTELIQELRKTYDIIVLDSPPLGLVTDALELSQYADASLFVIRLNYTKRGMLELVNAKHKTGELKNISYVLNFYKHSKSHGYGYGYGYSYGYGAYGNAYHENSRKETVVDKIKNWLKIG